MLRSARERMIQTAFYELGGVLLAAPLYALLFGEPAALSAGLVVAMSIAVLIWGPIHNTIFDLVELRLTGRPASDRPHGLRVVHAFSLEASDMVVTLPIIMLIGGCGLAEGCAVDLGFTLFYAAYAYLFHIAYVRLRPVMPVQSEGAVALPRPVIVSS